MKSSPVLMTLKFLRSCTYSYLLCLFYRSHCCWLISFWSMCYMVPIFAVLSLGWLSSFSSLSWAWPPSSFPAPLRLSLNLDIFLSVCVCVCDVCGGMHVCIVHVWVNERTAIIISSHWQHSLHTSTSHSPITHTHIHMHSLVPRLSRLRSGRAWERGNKANTCTHTIHTHDTHTHAHTHTYTCTTHVHWIRPSSCTRVSEWRDSNQIFI